MQHTRRMTSEMPVAGCVPILHHRLPLAGAFYDDRIYHQVQGILSRDTWQSYSEASSYSAHPLLKLHSGTGSMPSNAVGHQQHRQPQQLKKVWMKLYLILMPPIKQKETTSSTAFCSCSHSAFFCAGPASGTAQAFP